MKSCPRCSAAIAEGSRFCAACGADLADASARGAGPSGTHSVRPGSGNPGSLWLALNIALAVLSCFSNVVSIVGVVFGAIAVTRYNEGRFGEAQNNANVSKWLLVAAVVLTVGGIAVALVAGVLPVLLGLLGLLWFGSTSSFTTF